MTHKAPDSGVAGQKGRGPDGTTENEKEGRPCGRPSVVRVIGRNGYSSRPTTSQIGP
jgi:hypothetical protein